MYSPMFNTPNIVLTSKYYLCSPVNSVEIVVVAIIVDHDWSSHAPDAAHVGLSPLSKLEGVATIGVGVGACEKSLPSQPSKGRVS